MTAIKTTNLSKKYDVYAKQSHRIKEFFSFGRRSYHSEHWALKGLSFAIEKGTTIGVIGANGSGKSTLLKIIAGITYPTEGTVETHGRIAALIELGTGFHPEFSGRANVYMNASLMGIDSKEIDKKFDEILDFSELHDFIDFPVKTYSSGMYVRLAFSVAINVNPDILLIDEALAVGDVIFQHRCIKKIREFQEKGVTIFFVSHDPGAVKTLCNKAMLLDNGAMLEIGDTGMIMDKYNRLVTQKEAQSVRSIKIDKKMVNVESTGMDSKKLRYGSLEAKILNVVLLNENEQKRHAFVSGENMVIRVEIEILKNMNDLTTGFVIRNRFGFEIFGTNTYHQRMSIDKCRKKDRIIVDFKQKVYLAPNEYFITIALHSTGVHLAKCFDWWDDAANFKIVPSYPVFTGIINLASEISYRRIQDEHSK